MAHVVIVGGGMVGLSTAWFLRERGEEVTVVDAGRAGMGASWGNAGWLTPGISTPLPDPAILSYGLRAVLSPSSPVYMPISFDPELWGFLLRFLRNSTPSRWATAMRSLIGINVHAFEAFDELAGGGSDGRGKVVVPTVTPGEGGAAPFVAAYTDPRRRAGLQHEFDQIDAAGQPVSYELLDGDEVRALVPALSETITAGIRLDDTRFIDPPRYVAALREAVLERGVTLWEDTEVLALDDAGGRVRLALRPASGGGTSSFAHDPARTTAGDVEGRPAELVADQVVLATGALLGRLARRLGVRTTVRAGRGYSFTVPADPMPTGPVYFPYERVACTPLGDRFRVAGMMEFRRSTAPFDPRRVAALVRASRPLFRDLRTEGAGVDLEDRADEWVGSRPCTPDGLPLVGRTRHERVFVAGGHGMWGVTLGPATGKFLAEMMTTGTTPEPLRPFDPLR